MRKIGATIVAFLILVLPACGQSSLPVEEGMSVPSTIKVEGSGVFLAMAGDLSPGTAVQYRIYQQVGVDEIIGTFYPGETTYVALAAGNYEMVVSAATVQLDCSGATQFIVLEGQVKEVQIHLNCTRSGNTGATITLITKVYTQWTLSLNAASPAGMIVPGFNQEVLRVNVMHDSPDDAYVDELQMNVQLSGDATVTNCTVTAPDSTFLMGTVWSTVSVAYSESSHLLGGEVVVAPATVRTLVFRCDISGSVDSVLVPRLVGFRLRSTDDGPYIESTADGNTLVF